MPWTNEEPGRLTETEKLSLAREKDQVKFQRLELCFEDRLLLKSYARLLRNFAGEIEKLADLRHLKEWQVLSMASSAFYSLQLECDREAIGHGFRPPSRRRANRKHLMERDPVAPMPFYRKNGASR